MAVAQYFSVGTAGRSALSSVPAALHDVMICTHTAHA
jgi:hypothetical protein